MGPLSWLKSRLWAPVTEAMDSPALIDERPPQIHDAIPLEPELLHNPRSSEPPEPVEPLEPQEENTFVDETLFKRGDSLQISDLEDTSIQMNARQQMELEKTRYAGAASWTPSEGRLFEILYLRQTLPLLPSHWSVDFCGIPLGGDVFMSSEKFRPVIFAHDRMREFAATMALTQLIDLTCEVRTAYQSGFRVKGPKRLRKGLRRYASWAARDGGLAHLKTVPNLFIEHVNVAQVGKDMSSVTEYMKYRMRDLAELQRGLYQPDPEPDFWTDMYPRLMNHKVSIANFRAFVLQRQREEAFRSGAAASTPMTRPSLNTPAKIPWQPQKELERKRRAYDDELDILENFHTPPKKKARRSHSMGTPCSGNGGSGDSTSDVKIKKEESPAAWPSDILPSVESSLATKLESGRSTPLGGNRSRAGDDNDQDEKSSSSPQHWVMLRPPVVYGLFVLETTVFVLTVDPAQGARAYISYFVDLDMLDAHRSVWNAITIAIVVCLARDELRFRRGLFEELEPVDESDPDA